MTRLLLTAATVAALVVPATADARTAHKNKQHGGHHARMMQSAPVGMYRGHRHRGYNGYGYNGGSYGYGGYGYAAPNWNTTVGPPWAGPNQCFEDLGYGRYESCDQD
jgi:uncharacterized membrane protein